MAYTLTKFKARRALYHKLGLGLFWGGLLLLLIDMTTAFPTPVYGQYALWWLIVVGLGAYFWHESKKLPLEETLEIAARYRGVLRVPQLVTELNVTIDTAERILDALTRRKYAAPEKHPKDPKGYETIWVFHDLTPGGAAPAKDEPQDVEDLA